MNVRTKESGAGIGNERGGLCPSAGGSAASLPTVPAHPSLCSAPSSRKRACALTPHPGLARTPPPPAVLPALQEAIVFVDSLSPDTEGSELATTSSVSRTAPASEEAPHACWLNEWEAGVQGERQRLHFRHLLSIRCSYRWGICLSFHRLIQPEAHPAASTTNRRAGLTIHLHCCHSQALRRSVPGLFQAFL